MITNDKRKMRNHHGNVEIQGQRLSAYASSNVSDLTKTDSKNRGCDKIDLSKIENLKCSCDMGHLSNRASLSHLDTTEVSSVKSTSTTTTNANNKDQSAATHIISNHRHNVPLKTKSTGIHLKCSCNIIATNTEKVETETALDRKQNILLKNEKKSKLLRHAARMEKIDMATSPKLPVRHVKVEDKVASDNSQTVIAPVFSGNNETVKCNSSAVIMAALIHPIQSPRREIPTRNAATSPHHFDARKRDKCQEKTVKISATGAINMTVSKLTLEKSKSLNEARPQRQLRTTRSLSPRPPVRHQQAIIISDENDIVLEVTRSEDFSVVNTHDSESDRLNVRKALSKIAYKAQSENTSPNLHEGDAFFAGDQYALNMSTGCLVYVPSDPWMKMTDKMSSPKNMATESSLGRISKIRSQSMAKNDPWVYRNTDTGQLPISPRPFLSRQCKSLANSNESGPRSRPKLQRCKSPIVVDDAFLCTDVLLTAANNHNENEMIALSPQKFSKPSANKRAQPPNCLLKVSSTNSMLQPRHSFSSLSRKDDELQLNIRRLSEQIKSSSISNSSATVSTADVSTYLKHCSTTNKPTLLCDLSNNVISNLQPPSTTTKRDADAVLETTC